MASAVEPEVIWQPNEGPQSALLSCPVREVFYGGARGGGKTDGLLGDWLAHAGEYGAHAKGLIVRRTYPELADVIERSRALLGPLGWNYREQEHDWRGPDGALLRMRYLKRDSDAQGYQGHSYTWIGVDEAGNFPSSKPIDLLRGTLRSAHGVPTYLRLTGNPGGPGHGWLKRRYIDPHPEGLVPFAYEANGVEIEAVFIPSTLDDNPHLIQDKAYQVQLAAATSGDEALYEAWRFGRWDVFVGQMYRVLRGEQIMKNRPPEDFARNTIWTATLDWGYVQGCYGLFATETKEALELADEFYDQFTELTARKAAHAIVEWHKRHKWPLPSEIACDEQMWQKHGTEGKHLAEEFRLGLVEAVGKDVVPPAVLKARHPAGSRETKVALIQEWLAAGDERDDAGELMPWALPSLRIHERCKNVIRVLQEIPRDPENPNDVDPDYADDHPHDMVGFAVARRPRTPRVSKTLRQADESETWKEMAKQRGIALRGEAPRVSRGAVRVPRRGAYERME